MKELLNYILENILTAEETFRIEEEVSDEITLLKIYLKPDTMGKIIGKGGKTINSIKNILKIKAMKDQVRVEVEVAEETQT